MENITINNKEVKNNKRTIYLWDLHWSDIFSDFINLNNIDNTKFVSLWDIFDRWNNSYEIYLTIKKLYENNQYDMILWNHDLFFIYWIWLSEKYDWFLLQEIKNNTKYSKNYDKYTSLWKETLMYLINNGGDLTIDSIIENHMWMYWQKKTDLSQLEINKRLNEVAEFLYNFNLYKIDENNNLLVHWWIPILNDWSIVSIEYDRNITNWWIELLEAFNHWLKNLDLWIITALITWASAEYQDFNIFEKMKANNLIKDVELINSLIYRSINTTTHFLPNWYLNYYYLSNEKIWKSLKTELSKNNINALIVWHSWNDIYDEWFCNINSDYWKHLLWQNNTLIRIDRSFLKKHNKRWNFWYITYENWKYIKVWDALDLFN